jgi:ABC-type sugar transport system substrate-binding protein
MRMKSFATLAAMTVLGAALGWAAAAASYQKTGVVKEVAADSFTLDLGKEEWRFYTDGGTAGKEALKAGDKVTVTYKQVATKIESKGAAKAPAKKK